MAPDSFWSNGAILKITLIFSDLKERAIFELSQICHTRSYEKGEVIFQEGELGAGMYVMVEGAVRILTHGSDAQEIELARMGKGDFFGRSPFWMMALARRRPSPVSQPA